MKPFISSVLCFLIFSLFVSAQDINQFDANGKNHGKWSKFYEDSKVLRYEGTFFHGKEIDTFKYYKNVDNKPSLAAIKIFNKNNDIADVKFFSSKGKLISEGKMNGKIYIGTWKYYHNKGNNLLTIEHYNDAGQLHGERLVYYENGNLAEKEIYKNGKRHGVCETYADITKKVLKHYVYENGELHGLSKYYDATGELIVEGRYKRDKKDGIWKYYEGGKLKEEKDFTYKPKFVKQKVKTVPSKN